MAIAVDATSSSANQTGSSVTFAHTCGGSNRILVVAVSIAAGIPTVSGITYNGVALTQIATVLGVAADRRTELWYLIAPATGANNIVVTLSGAPGAFFNVGAVSYTGVKQTGQPDATANTNNTSNVTTTSQAVTTVDDNCWLVGAICDGAADGSAVQSGTTFRLSVYNRVGAAGYELFFIDSNGAKTPAGSYSLGETHNSNRSAIIVASLSPVASTNYTKDLVDSFALVDTVKRDTSKRLVDAFSLVDVVYRGAGKLITDVITLVDVVDIIQIFTKALTETITLVDTVKRDTAKILTEAVTLVDSAARAMTRSLVDVITLADTTAINTFYAKILTDAIALSDSIQKATGKYITETITLVETVATRFTAILLTDVFTLVDSKSMIHGFILSLTETISLNDVLTKALAYSRRLTESISLSTRLFLNGVNAAWLLKYAQKATTWIGKYTDPK